MATTDAHAISPTNGQVATDCAVCPHPRDEHDKIALRYCDATAASGHQNRGCVCPKVPNTG